MHCDVRRGLWRGRHCARLRWREWCWLRVTEQLGVQTKRCLGLKRQQPDQPAIGEPSWWDSVMLLLCVRVGQVGDACVL